jgi:release factor glutamine methyltransferase
VIGGAEEPDVTIATALRQGEQLLAESGDPVPRLTAEVLLRHALHCDRAFLYGHPEQELTDLQWLHFGRYLHERREGKPTQYITRRQEFYGREFRVNPAVMIPRPETEHLIETALEVGRGARVVVDVGCGSGAIAVTLQLETQACVVATDISAAALEVAADNARRLGAAIHLVRCDLTGALANQSCDVLISNPPYVPLAERDSLQREVRDWEPHVALFAGPEGLDIYRRLIEESPRLLKPGGWLIVELGIRQLEAVRAMLSSEWGQARVIDDLAGLPRVLAVQCGRNVGI